MDPIDFSKINFKKPTGGDSKQAPNAVSTKDAESQVPSQKSPQAGINFKKLNFGKPAGETGSTQSPARTSPAAPVTEDSQASRRDDLLQSTKKQEVTNATTSTSDSKPTNANSTLVGESTTNATRVSATNANNVSGKVSGATNSESTNVDIASNGSNVKNATNAKSESRSFFTNANGVDATTNSNSVDDSVVENPFLDDDDEYTLDVSEISLGRSRGSSYDSDSDEAEPFLGFDDTFKGSSSKSGSTSGSENVSKSTNANTIESTTNANSRTVSGPVASSREVDLGDSGDGFDDLLDDLLDDDEYVASSDSVSGSSKYGSDSASSGSESTNAKNATNATTNSVSDSSRGATNVDSVSSSGSNSFVDGRSSDVAGARDRVKKNSSEEIELDPRTVSDLELRRKKNRDAQAKREASREPAVKKVPKRSRLESEFVKQAPVEVLVDENGRPLAKLSDASDAVEESTTNANGVTSSSTTNVEKQRYRYVRPDGRLNGAELEFFKNAQVSKTEVLSNPNEMARLRGPLDRNETELERRERQKHIVRAAAGRNGMQRGKQPRFGQKEREVLEFLAMFRYATDRQLARMFSESQGTAYNRLKRLRQQGLVIDKKIYGNRPIWFLTDAGLVISGYDLPRVTESKLTFSMFPHQFTVNNTAANLWGANVNVLHQEDYPAKNRSNSRNEKVYGENLVSELEIQSSFGKVKGFDKADVYRPQLLGNIEREFRDWKRAGGVEFGPSPEMIYGNEYMWSLMPPFSVHLAYHVPDLVIKRPRNADGSPNSIAVEIEISNKPADSYEKTLYAYKSDNRLYKKVIWVCKNAGPARKLETIAKEIGLWQDGRIDIVPVITEDGVFKERDLWTI